MSYEMWLAKYGGCCCCCCSYTTPLNSNNHHTRNTNSNITEIDTRGRRLIVISDLFSYNNNNNHRAISSSRLKFNTPAAAASASASASASAVGSSSSRRRTRRQVVFEFGYCSKSTTTFSAAAARRCEPPADDDDDENQLLLLLNNNNNNNNNKKQVIQQEEEEEEDHDYSSGFGNNNDAIISACFVGLITGIAVVLFNLAVHEIRDLCWDGNPNRGTSWLRDQPTEAIWKQVVLVPACGGLVVGMLNFLRASLETPMEGVLSSTAKDVLEPIFKTMAACVTLGTGNSLGPEGPSADIGASIAKGVGTLFDRGAYTNLSLKAAGSAAGIASGFNAAVAGCFFAIESVLWPSPLDSPLSLTNTTSMVILSAVIASVISEIGLGSEPTFKVPGYDFRSPTELPLYLLLGVLCGMVSLILSWCTSFMVVTFDNVQKNLGIPKAAFPVFGGLSVGLIALAYPEILYRGFENVDVLLESWPFVNELSADLLLQLVAVKIICTSLCRASGLVGGYYAPSLFIGAATGMSYGKFVNLLISQSNPVFHLSVLDVASPQAYGLVGMAATLAGVCQVPLTAVLLLFELTQDYRIVLPLLGAVGLSSWITSAYAGTREGSNAVKLKEGNKHSFRKPDTSSCIPYVPPSSPLLATKQSCRICLQEEHGDPLYVDVTDTAMIEVAKKILVSQAMRTQYVTVTMTTFLTEAVTLMLAEKQSCAVIVDDERLLIGLLTLGDIQEFSELSKEMSRRPEELVVSELCHSKDGKRWVSLTVTPSMSLLSAHLIMSRCGMSQLPVIYEHVEDRQGQPVGILDTECISLACRAFTTKEFLSQFSKEEQPPATDFL